MRIVLLLIVAGVVLWLGARQLQSTVAVPKVQVPAANSSTSSDANAPSAPAAVPLPQAPKAVGEATQQMLQQGADRLKEADQK